MTTKTTTQAINATIKAEMEQQAQIKKAKGAILNGILDLVCQHEMTDKQVEEYLSKLVKANVKAGTAQRTADADKAQRKPIMLFLTGNTDAATHDQAVELVEEFMLKSVSMQALSKQVKTWIKDGIESDDSDESDVNNINTDEADTETDETPTQESDAVQQAIEAQKVKIDDLNAYLFEAIKQGWTVAQLQQAIDDLACIEF